LAGGELRVKGKGYKPIDLPDGCPAQSWWDVRLFQPGKGCMPFFGAEDIAKAQFEVTNFEIILPIHQLLIVLDVNRPCFAKSQAMYWHAIHVTTWIALERESSS